MPDSARKAAFIDRDGVINVERGYVHRIEDFELIDGVVEALRILHEHGYILIVVTNQAGIAKGYYTEESFHKLTLHMRALLQAQGVEVADVYHCPHHPDGVVQPYAKSCDCRKPQPGLLYQAAIDLGVNLSASVLVGDKVSDVEAGRAAGVGRRMLVRSGHVLPEDAAVHADFVGDHLLDAVRWLMASS